MMAVPCPAPEDTGGEQLAERRGQKTPSGPVCPTGTRIRASETKGRGWLVSRCGLSRQIRDRDSDRGWAPPRDTACSLALHACSSLGTLPCLRGECKGKSERNLRPRSGATGRGGQRVPKGKRTAGDIRKGKTKPQPLVWPSGRNLLFLMCVPGGKTGPRASLGGECRESLRFPNLSAHVAEVLF